jgi:hypothetical protein
MPFLIPAITAAICDVAILVVSRHDPLISIAYDEDGDGDGDGEYKRKLVYQVGYMFPFAACRLFLLFLPLPYHSYNGTALRCPRLYVWWYASTLFIVLLHMLSLSMIDPHSLSSLLPTPMTTAQSSTPSLHDALTRHLWLLLILTLATILCHVVLFLHVRSTAPPDADLLHHHHKRRPKVLFYYVKEQEGDNNNNNNKNNNNSISERDSLLGTSQATNQNNNNNNQQQQQQQQQRSDSAHRMKRISDQFLLDLQTRMQQAKEDWTKRLDDYRIRSGSHHHHHHHHPYDHSARHSTNTNNSTSTTSSGTNPPPSGPDLLLQPPLTPFRVMLQLFAYEDVLSNGRLNAIYDLDDGTSIMFFVPQLLSFLLHGAYESSPLLEEWILDICRRNVYFCHRCYWFLRAWSLEAATGAGGTTTRLSQSSSLASFEALYDTTSSGDLGASTNPKFLPEERVVIEQLLRRVMEAGETPARLLYFGGEIESERQAAATTKTTTTTATATATANNSHSSTFADTSSPSALVSAVESGMIPIDPTTKMASPKHWDCVAASNRFGFLPLHEALTTQKQQRGHHTTSYFDTTPVFIDALLTIAENLFQVPKEQRDNEFKRQLQLLEVQALPSNAIYMPIQDSNHRVWRIVAEESIAISTKERVPCIIALEVVEYEKDEPPTSIDVRRLFERVAPAETTPQITLPDLTSHNTEREMIKQWRFGYREPRRRDTALEKLAYQMRHGMRKIPIDQMKNQVQAQLEKLKDTNRNLQDFWTINIPDTFEDEQEVLPSPLHTLEPMSSSDIERGLPDPQPSTPSKPMTTVPPLPMTTAPPLSPIIPGSPKHNDGDKKSSMGQWTSPHKTTVEDINMEDVDMADLFLPARKSVSYQRMDTLESEDTERGSNQSSSQGGGGALNGCLPGSKKNNDEEENPNGARKSKPPPVVFKENWKEKSERIRAGSAFGSHPGWRLLPVLVKANDDLRQEQLASQLIYRISAILARERISVWLYPYEIVAITETGGLIEAIPDTISIASLKKNDPSYTGLKAFFQSFFTDPDDLADAKANFCESLAAYSMVCFLLQIKDRHNGNILLDNRGHIIHIDFGFFFLSSPGKNTGFESAPFKLTREFVEVLDGPDSRLFRIFRMLCYKSFIALRRHCLEIILLVEMLKNGNEELSCFRGRPDDAISELRHRFRLDLNDRACLEYVNALIDESLENWRTNWYDRYQRYCVGVL